MGRPMGALDTPCDVRCPLSLWGGGVVACGVGGWCGGDGKKLSI